MNYGVVHGYMLVTHHTMLRVYCLISTFPFYLPVCTSRLWLSQTLVVLIPGSRSFYCPFSPMAGGAGGILLPALLNIFLTVSSSGCHMPPWPRSLLWHVFHKLFAFIGAKGTQVGHSQFLLHDRQDTLPEGADGCRLHASFVGYFCAYLLLRRFFCFEVENQGPNLRLLYWDERMCVCYLPLPAGIRIAHLYVVEVLLLTTYGNVLWQKRLCVLTLMLLGSSEWP